jgi:hypothetical protein
MGPMNGLNAFERQNPSDRSRTDDSTWRIVLANHVKLSGIERMYLNVYVTRLQTKQGIVWLFPPTQPIASGH